MAKKRRRKGQDHASSSDAPLDEKSKNFVILLVVIGVLLLGAFIALELST